MASSINNGKNPTECLWIDDSITVLNSNGYTFKKIEPEVSVPDTPTVEEPIVEDPVEDNNSSDNTTDTDTTVDDNNSSTEVVKPKLIFTCKSDDIYAIELKAGQKLYLE